MTLEPTGGSYLCRNPSASAWTLGGIALALGLDVDLRTTATPAPPAGHKVGP